MRGVDRSRERTKQTPPLLCERLESRQRKRLALNEGCWCLVRSVWVSECVCGKKQSWANSSKNPTSRRIIVNFIMSLLVLCSMCVAVPTPQTKTASEKWLVIWKQKPTCSYILICSLAIACSTFPYSLHCKHVHAGSQLGLYRPRRLKTWWFGFYSKI